MNEENSNSQAPGGGNEIDNEAFSETMANQSHPELNTNSSTAPEVNAPKPEGQKREFSDFMYAHLPPDKMTEVMKSVSPLECVSTSNSVLINSRKLPSAEALKFHLNEVLNKLKDEEPNPNFNDEIDSLLGKCRELKGNLMKEAQMTHDANRLFSIDRHDDPLTALVKLILQKTVGNIKPEAMDRIDQIRDTMITIESGIGEINKEQAKRETIDNKFNNGPKL